MIVLYSDYYDECGYLDPETGWVRIAEGTIFKAYLTSRWIPVGKL